MEDMRPHPVDLSKSNRDSQDTKSKQSTHIIALNSCRLLSEGLVLKFYHIPTKA